MKSLIKESAKSQSLTRSKFIEKWLEALESGKYRQGKNFLVVNDEKGMSYCCLGVACMVAGEDAEELADRGEKRLPYHLRRNFGIDANGAFLEHVKHRGQRYYSLAQLNDGGVRFKTIARIIREQMAKGNFEKP